MIPPWLKYRAIWLRLLPILPNSPISFFYFRNISNKFIFDCYLLTVQSISYKFCHAHVDGTGSLLSNLILRIVHANMDAVTADGLFVFFRSCHILFLSAVRFRIQEETFTEICDDEGWKFILLWPCTWEPIRLLLIVAEGMGKRNPHQVASGQ